MHADIQQETTIKDKNQLFASKDYDCVSYLVQGANLIHFKLSSLFQFIYMNA